MLDTEKNFPRNQRCLLDTEKCRSDAIPVKKIIPLLDIFSGTLLMQNTLYNCDCTCLDEWQMSNPTYFLFASKLDYCMQQVRVPFSDLTLSSSENRNCSAGLHCLPTFLNTWSIFIHMYNTIYSLSVL